MPTIIGLPYGSKTNIYNALESEDLPTLVKDA